MVWLVAASDSMQDIAAKTRSGRAAHVGAALGQHVAVVLHVLQLLEEGRVEGIELGAQVLVLRLHRQQPRPAQGFRCGLKLGSGLGLGWSCGPGAGLIAGSVEELSPAVDVPAKQAGQDAVTAETARVSGGP